MARDPDASVAHRYKVTATPTLILLDAQGVTYQGNRLPGLLRPHYQRHDLFSLRVNST